MDGLRPGALPSFPLRVPIDPRIRRRRIEVRRHEGRRRLRLLLAMLALLGVTAAAWLAVRSPLLDVDTVRVTGASRTAPDDVRRAGHLDTGRAMLDVDEERASERIEGLPWVADAEVTRRWPGTVSVSVTERTALVAAYEDGGRWWILDRSGRVLEQSDVQPPGLLAVGGVGVAGGAGSQASGGEGVLAVVAALSPELAARVSAVVVGDGGQIEVKLNPRGTVRLGPAVDVDAKLRAVETVLASIDVRTLDVLDVRLPASPVLTRL